MPEHPFKLFHSGPTSAVPLLAGTNTNEGALFVFPFYEKGMNNTQYKAFVGEVFDGHDPKAKLNASELAQVLNTYRPTEATSDRRLLASALMTDSTFLCGTQAAAQAYASVADVFLYRFNHRSTCRAGLNKSIPGVYHSMEIIYVWGDPVSEACLWDPQEAAL